MSWETLQPDYVALYAELFTAEELQGLLDFYTSPIGRRLVEKSAAIAAATLQSAHDKTAALMPRLMQQMMLPAPPTQGVAP